MVLECAFHSAGSALDLRSNGRALWHVVVIVGPDDESMTRELMLSAGVGRVAVFYGCQM